MTKQNPEDMQDEIADLKEQLFLKQSTIALKNKTIEDKNKIIELDDLEIIRLKKELEEKDNQIHLLQNSRNYFERMFKTEEQNKKKLLDKVEKMIDKFDEKVELIFLNNRIFHWNEKTKDNDLTFKYETAINITKQTLKLKQQLKRLGGRNDTLPKIS